MRPRRRAKRTASNEAPIETIGTALDEYLSDAGLKEVKVFSLVESSWEEIAGPAVAAHARPKALRDGELVIAVDHGGWVTELAFQGERIIRAVNERLKTEAVLRLNVLVADGFGVDYKR